MYHKETLEKQEIYHKENLIQQRLQHMENLNLQRELSVQQQGMQLIQLSKSEQKKAVPHIVKALHVSNTPHTKSVLRMASTSGVGVFPKTQRIMWKEQKCIVKF